LSTNVDKPTQDGPARRPWRETLRKSFCVTTAAKAPGQGPPLVTPIRVRTPCTPRGDPALFCGGRFRAEKPGQNGPCIGTRQIPGSTFPADRESRCRWLREDLYTRRKVALKKIFHRRPASAPCSHPEVFLRPCLGRWELRPCLPVGRDPRRPHVGGNAPSGSGADTSWPARNRFFYNPGP